MQDDMTVLRRLTDVFEELRKVHPDMTLNQALVLIRTAMKPGITQREIMRDVGLADSTASRIIAILSNIGNRGTGPFELVSLKEAIEDRRQKHITLTHKGRQVVASIIKALGGGKLNGSTA